MKKFIIFIIFGLVIILAGFLVYLNQKQIVGGDEDEHGCIGSAGYSWCEAKQKCLRVWEEPCSNIDNRDQEDLIKTQIKKAIVEKHGQNASTLDITVSIIEGSYAKGGASVKDMGGGMWFATKVDDEWKLVWDGNGIIACSILTPYPNFPVSLIPECFDESVNQLITRSSE